MAPQVSHQRQSLDQSGEVVNFFRTFVFHPREIMPHNSSTEENYLKAIYKYSDESEMVSTNTLSRDIKTTPASVTDMLKKLSEKQLVNYIPYKGARLTNEGKKIALRIIRKHRLWEVFLVNTLHFSWDNVHDTAEQLEHINSPELIKKLDEFLGFPKFDPHGDPIPSEEGEFEERKTFTIEEMEANTSAIMAGVTLHNSEFLRYLDRIGLNIGSEVSIVEKIAFDKSVALRIGEKDVIINGETARNILVMKG